MSKGRNFCNSNQEIHQGSFAPTMFNLSDFGKKKVEVSFTNERISNDGGLLLLNEIENQIGLIDKLASCIVDTRHQSYIDHSIESMLKQRIMQIAAGYEDANDCNTMRDDGILKICAGKQQTLASQPTMSRLENLASARDLYRMGKVS